jgi:large subunit ribosomal protein L3
MKKAILGKKLGMTQVFTQDGLVVPVTVIEAGPCYVVQKKTVLKDGYKATVVAFGKAKEKNTGKPLMGIFKKANIAPQKFIKEFNFDNTDSYELGQTIKCDIFNEKDMVDVSGKTRGRGFTGTIQRWNAKRLKMTHGVGPVHRQVGSMGANTSPARVFKSKKMPGHYGCENVTIQNLEVIRVDANRNIILVKGCVPGPKGTLLTVREAVKA